MLYVDRMAIGAIEAKPEGTLTGVEEQSAKYAVGLPDDLPAHHRPLPFVFESNGSRTAFTNGLDPTPRSRHVFNFPRPETLAEWLALPTQMRARLRALPALDESRLWSVQARALRNLEESLGRSDQRALIQMAMGSGKTFTAVNAAYRLLKHGGARRVLFLVDRNNLGRQTHDEFANFNPPDDARKFPELYIVQRLAANAINPAANVVITTIQRLYSMLKGDAEYDSGNEEDSAFGSPPSWHDEPPDVEYNPSIPPEYFDFIIVDECHRSIYNVWSQVLLYFDAFLVGLTATPDNRTIAFFSQNLIVQYGHDEAVIDGVNVDFDVYRIRTKVTEQGATIEADGTGVFRLSFVPRIAVTVDMISTGTDVKPIECVFFMRNIASAGFFEQMKGRGVRVISPDKLRAVIPSARVKDRFIVVDAVGVCERDKTDSRPLNRQPSRTLAQILNHVARGGINPDALTSLAARIARLQRRFSPAQLEELKELAGGKPIPDLARGLTARVRP